MKVCRRTLARVCVIAALAGASLPARAQTPPATTSAPSAAPSSTPQPEVAPGATAPSGPAVSYPGALPGVRALDPDRVQAMLRPPIESGDAGRTFANAWLFLPRKTVELLFQASGVAAGILRDQQVVPRVSELLAPRPGQLTVFPTLYAGFRRAPSVGLRMLSSGRWAATSFGVGFGGTRDINGEARIRVGRPVPVPFVISIEGFADVRSNLTYYGLGQDPFHDPRNQWRSGPATCGGTLFDQAVRTYGVPRPAHYLERRTRGILSLGLRAGQDVELFLSTGFTLSRVEDTPESGCQAISEVFAPGTVPGASGFTKILYTELAVRLDTRPTLGRPSPGTLVELYAGHGRGAAEDRTSFLRVGGRAGLYLPILSKNNILSPRIAIDGLAATEGVPVPFTALVDQPDFRGFDTRRDKLSVVASLDYRWAIFRYLGARLFFDLATVGADFGSLFDAGPRWATGAGFDVYSRSTELGQFAISGSAEGVRVLLSVGLSQAFGDRQHRY